MARMNASLPRQAKDSNQKSVATPALHARFRHFCDDQRFCLFLGQTCPATCAFVSMHGMRDRFNTALATPF